VPVYNEIGNIVEFHKELLKALKGSLLPYEIIYVDDHSTDGTYQWLIKEEMLLPRKFLTSPQRVGCYQGSSRNSKTRKSR